MILIIIIKIYAHMLLNCIKEFGETGTKQSKLTGHDGVFLVKPDDVNDYLEKFKPMQLREKGQLE